jgi:hypothetical protein
VTKKSSGIFVVAMTVLLGGFDLYLNWDRIPGNTYSEVLRTWSYDFRWLPYLIAASMGALLSHWFAKPYEPDPMIPAAWQKRPLKDRLTVAGAMLFTVAIGMGIGFFW